MDLARSLALSHHPYMATETSSPQNRGWIVAGAGLGINLALGVLYTWSIFKGAIEKDFHWQGTQLNDPYALCCLVFSFTMILAGRCQDQFGPRVTAIIGGLLVGMGIGFGYSSATPPALKWFPASKTGLIAGLVVAGFGLAPVYLAPTADYLLRNSGLLQSMFILGVVFAVVIVCLALLLINPPAGYRPGAAQTTSSPP